MKTNRIVFCLLLLVFSGYVLAETPTGLRGTVTDPSGAVIPGAEVVIRYHYRCHDHRDSIPERSVTTNQAGEFEVNLQSGFYDVMVMADCFAPIAENVTIKPREQLVFSRKLKISSYENLGCNEIIDDVIPRPPIATITSNVLDKISEPPSKKRKK